MSNEIPPADAESPSDPPAPQWPRPLTPLPPYRLAKLANALGISTPLPPRQHSPPPEPPTLSLPSAALLTGKSSSFSDYRRSPTPSAASTSYLTAHSTPSSQPPSKFLLHVIPPHHLPHDPDSYLTPPPSSATGYHTQFRRGVLVPLFPTLQSQLGAIAKEYALPSTNGVILYLVASSPVPSAANALTPPDKPQALVSELVDEPGPRLSEEIWKHLWTRVTRVEQDAFPSRATTPNSIGLGLGLTERASPSAETNGESSSTGSTNANPLRPLMSTGRITAQPLTKSQPLTLTMPTTPNPSTPSSYSSSQHSQPSPVTPDTSFPSSAERSRANTLELPGLSSPGIIPVLAKVEFDIDKRRAGWYEPWIRSRRMNAKKRAGVSASASDTEGSEAASQTEGSRSAPLGLKLVDRQAVPRFLQSDVVDEDMMDDEVLAESPSDLQQQPQLSITIPPPPPPEAEGARRRSSPTTAGTIKKQPPPPLNLPNPHDLGIAATGSPDSVLPSSKLPYLRSGQSTATNTDEASTESAGAENAEVEDGGEDDEQGQGARKRVKSPVGERRVGAFFEDLDLGLEFEESGEFDENDPHDRRRSQYVMKAQLDQIEKNLAQFSPRRLIHDVDELPPTSTPPRSSSLRGTDSGHEPSLSPPGQPQFLGSPGRVGTKVNGSAAGSAPPVWPAVPYSSLNADDQDDDSDLRPSSQVDDFPTPPRLALNGVSNAIPVSPYAKHGVPAATHTDTPPSDESLARKREFAGQDPTYPDIIPPSLRKGQNSAGSPVIPLSPDPFGRFPSEPPPIEVQQGDRMSYDSIMSGATAVAPRTHSKFEGERKSTLSTNSSSTMDSEANRHSAAPSSRFSLDSTDDPHLTAKGSGSSSLNPVKSIRKLWRKSNKSSISSVSDKSTGSATSASAAGGRASPQTPPVPQTPQEVVSNAMVPPRRPMPPPQQHEPLLTTTQAAQRAQAQQSINFIHFDQESPYPIRRSPQPPPPPPPVSYGNRTSQRRPSESFGYGQPQSSSPDLAPRTSMGSPTIPPAPLDGKAPNGARKSILKGWKSPPSTLSQSSSNPNIASSSDGSGSDGVQARKRRPSVIDMASSLVRSSMSGSMPEIPPSPVLPEQYIAANATRTSTRQSRTQSIVENGKRFSVRTGGSAGRVTPSSSMDSRSTPPSVRTPLPGASPPRAAIARASEEDETFELIEPPHAGHAKAPSLSYPYNELDHQA